MVSKVSMAGSQGLGAVAGQLEYVVSTLEEVLAAPATAADETVRDAVVRLRQARDGLRELGAAAVSRELITTERVEDRAARSEGLLLALSRAAEVVGRARTAQQAYEAVGGEVAKLGYHAMVLTLTDDRAHLGFSYMPFDSAALRAAEKAAGVSAQDFNFAVVPGGYHDQIVTEGRTVFFEQAHEVIAETLPKVPRALIRQVAAFLRYRQGIYSPLRIAGEIRGVLAVVGEDLSEADIPAVSAFANQASIALENAQLHEQARADVDEREQRTRALAAAVDQREREIAERKRAEEEVRESEERYRALFEGSPVALWEEDPKWLRNA